MLGPDGNAYVLTTLAPIPFHDVHSGGGLDAPLVTTDCSE
jgi:hypothetical protein